MVMSKPIWPVEEEQEQQQQRKINTNINSFHWSTFSEIPKHKQEQTLDRCRLLTNRVYYGLDLKHEIIAVNNQNLGDTILLYRNSKNNTAIKDNDNNLISFAVCHCGAGSEAGSGVCYIKFGIVLSDINSLFVFISFNSLEQLRKNDVTMIWKLQTFSD